MFKVGQKVQFLGDMCDIAKEGDIVTITQNRNDTWEYFTHNGKNCFHKSKHFKPLKKTWDALEVGDILVYKNSVISGRRVLAIIDEVVAMASGSGILWYTLADLKNNWTIKEADTTQELTLDDIAKKFDIPLDQLRIKDK